MFQPLNGIFVLQSFCSLLIQI
ncbi:unnamed protein product [Acanthoscelides obtectus]|uniref:Uncharacterized protein n=1 Tax=Acanthoscelides obtectus TaxID=200917 RepID=A0A9P0M997_ACAOB|nr:unnamed protein product [Acanthoscelides obtectus]CAK1667977.1 hypothetical protein AOBTE_LOCUS26155 [Acanthoscelides obtectus]